MMMELQLLIWKTYTFCENCTTHAAGVATVTFYKEFWVSKWKEKIIWDSKL